MKRGRCRHVDRVAGSRDVWSDRTGHDRHRSRFNDWTERRYGAVVFPVTAKTASHSDSRQWYAMCEETFVWRACGGARMPTTSTTLARVSRSIVVAMCQRRDRLDDSARFIQVYNAV